MNSLAFPSRLLFLKKRMSVEDEADLFDSVARYRERELPELASTAYLDHMGSGLASASLRAVHQELLANPHSMHLLGQSASTHLERARHQTLHFFSATQEYDLIFTSGCTSSMSMVATLLPFGRSGCVLMHPFAHNSLLGIREMVTPSRYFVVNSPPATRDVVVNCASKGDINVLCVPAECNLSGAQMDIAEFVRAAKVSPLHEVLVIVDGAAIAGKAPIVMDNSGIDFFGFSFYKMFGAPTGLGALLVKKGRPQELLRAQKKYFGGGTVAQNTHTRQGGHLLRESFHAAMEDGTPNFYGIAQVPHGFSALEAVGGVEKVHMRIRYLRHFCIEALRALTHTNGKPLVQIYSESPVPVKGWGSSVAFSVLEQDGAFVGHGLVEKLLAGLRVYLRGGCMCNPGACSEFVDCNDTLMEEAKSAGHTCGDDMDLLDGRPLGCLRASFGSTSLPQDVHKLVAALSQCFIKESNSLERRHIQRPSLRIRDIVLYPIKGMPGVSVDSWPLLHNGLAFDRMWMLVDAFSNAPVVPKKFPVLAKGVVQLNLRNNALSVVFDGFSPLHIVLNETLRCGVADAHRTCATATSNVKLKNRTLETYRTYSDATDKWFTCALGVPVRLVRNILATDATLSNSAALLVIHEESHHLVLRHMQPEERSLVSLSSYRPNIIMTGHAALTRQATAKSPFVENHWSKLDVAGAQLVASGPCKRCQQVNVATGELKHEPLASISSLCRRNGLSEIVFGQLFDVAAFAPTPPSVPPRSSLGWWGGALVAIAGSVGLLRPSPLIIPAAAISIVMVNGMRQSQRHIVEHYDGAVLSVGALVDFGG